MLVLFEFQFVVFFSIVLLICHFVSFLFFIFFSFLFFQLGVRKGWLLLKLVGKKVLPIVKNSLLKFDLVFKCHLKMEVLRIWLQVWSLHSLVWIWFQVVLLIQFPIRMKVSVFFPFFFNSFFLMEMNVERICFVFDENVSAENLFIFLFFEFLFFVFSSRKTDQIILTYLVFYF